MCEVLFAHLLSKNVSNLERMEYTVTTNIIRRLNEDVALLLDVIHEESDEKFLELLTDH